MTARRVRWCGTTPSSSSAPSTSATAAEEARPQERRRRASRRRHRQDISVAEELRLALCLGQRVFAFGGRMAHRRHAPLRARGSRSNQVRRCGADSSADALQLGWLCEAPWKARGCAPGGALTAPCALMVTVRPAGTPRRRRRRRRRRALVARDSLSSAPLSLSLGSLSLSLSLSLSPTPASIWARRPRARLASSREVDTDASRLVVHEPAPSMMAKRVAELLRAVRARAVGHLEPSASSIRSGRAPRSRTVAHARQCRRRVAASVSAWASASIVVASASALAPPAPNAAERWQIDPPRSDGRRWRRMRHAWTYDGEPAHVAAVAVVVLRVGRARAVGELLD